MAMIGKAQSVIIGEMRYLYGQTVPYIKYTDTSDHTEHEIWDAKIVSVSGIRENSAGFDGLGNYQQVPIFYVYFYPGENGDRDRCNYRFILLSIK